MSMNLFPLVTNRRILGPNCGPEGATKPPLSRCISEQAFPWQEAVSKEDLDRLNASSAASCCEDDRHVNADMIDVPQGDAATTLPPALSRAIVHRQLESDGDQRLMRLSMIRLPPQAEKPHKDNLQLPPHVPSNDEVDDESPEEDDDDDDDEDEEEEDDEYELRLPAKSYHRGYSPPTAYLPLPPMSPSKQPASLTSCAPMVSCGWQSKHLLPDALISRLEANERGADAHRYAAFRLYDSLPKCTSGLPVLARLRRRLLRLAGHATLAHHRGKHEVIFQTTFLFDLILTRYSAWAEEKCRQASDGISLAAFFEEQSSTYNMHPPAPKKSVAVDEVSNNQVSRENTDQLSRMTTSASTTDSSSTQIVFAEAITKEDLRTLVMAALLLASKWNNSRYLPPGLLCSAPIGRVPLSNVLQLEIQILCTFGFDIPFKVSPLNLMHLYYGITEEETLAAGTGTTNCAAPCQQHSPRACPAACLSLEGRLCSTLALLILELSLSDYRGLRFRSSVLANSAMFLAEELTYAATLTHSPWAALTPSQQGPDFNEAVMFHLDNVEFEMKSAALAVPKLKALGRWANQMEAPNVFGVPVSARMPNTLAVAAAAQGDYDGKTKTESLALAFLRSQTAIAFDVLLAATLPEGFRMPHRSGMPCHDSKGVMFTSVRGAWCRGALIHDRGVTE